MKGACILHPHPSGDSSASGGGGARGVDGGGFPLGARLLPAVNGESTEGKHRVGLMTGGEVEERALGGSHSQLIEEVHRSEPNHRGWRV
jgi:hypothetical protein